MLNIHCHSEYSLLDGLARIENLIKRAKELNEDTICITDHGFMGAIVPAYLLCKKENIKLIVGCEFYVGREERNHLIVLAKDEAGYKNLLKLHAISYNKEHFYYKPTISEFELFAHREGLVITSSCLGGTLSKHIMKGDKQLAIEVAKEYKNAFGDDYYIEVQPNAMKKQEEVNRILIDVAKECNIKVVIGVDSHYVYKEDAFAHEVLLAIQTNKKITDDNRFKFDTNDMFVHSDEEIYEAFAKQGFSKEVVKEWIDNTNNIKSKCNVTIDTDTLYMPHYNGMSNEEEKLELGKRMNIWFAENKHKIDAKLYMERIKEELRVINSKHYAGYFLIVADYIKAFENMEVETYGIKQNLMCGAGRGSGVGSLVCYILGITKVNPIEYGLLFERFLNKDRLSTPDIDTDFDYEYRELGIDYMYDKYGVEHTAQISAFGTNQPKQVCRRVLSIFGYEMKVVNRIAKLIPDNAESIEDALEKAPELQFALANMQKELDVIKRLQLMVTTQSKHAAGIVVTTQAPIYELVPCHTTSENRDRYVMSLDKKKCEIVGQVKHDFLGLKTLTVLRKTLARIKKKHNIDIDLWNLPKDDMGVYAFLNEGKLMGIFQLDGSSASKIVEQVKPNCFDDIITCEAICRPGVKEAQAFINNEYEPTGVAEIDEILKDTRNCIVFQEQTMRLMNVMTGGKWTLGKADSMRKVKDLQEFKDDFMSCSVFPSDVTESIWNRFDLGYSFNKSHAVAYAFITYATAYLKTYYPVEYMTEFIDMYKDDNDGVLPYILECKSMGIKITPPNLNAKHVGFDEVDGTISFGLSGMKGVGEKAVKKLLEYTKSNPINTLDELIESKTLDKTGIIACIKAGCFDNEGTRQELYNKYILTRPKKERIEIKEFNDKIKLQWEKDVCGMYLTNHPLDKYILPKFSSVGLEGLTGGIVNSFRVIQTKKGDDMAFMDIETLEGIVHLTIFPRLYKEVKGAFIEGNIVMTRVKRDGIDKAICNTLEVLGRV